MKTDAQLESDVRAELAYDPATRDAVAIAVSSRAGTVTLGGVVRSLFERRAAVRVTRRVRGAAGVDDRLAVHPPVADLWPDDDIATSIQDALRRNAGVAGGAVTVRVSAGIVALEGHVPTDADRSAAVAVAELAPGITGVEDHLVVT